MPYYNGMTRPQGDPGFFSFVGKALKTVGGLAPGPVGSLLRAGGSVLDPRKAARQVRTFRTPGFVAQQQQPGFRGISVGGERGVRIGTTTPAPQPDASGKLCCPSGYHLAKDGSGRCVKNRRMDPLNPKALRRANRRQKAFLRQVDKTLASMPTKASVKRRRRHAKSGSK